MISIVIPVKNRAQLVKRTLQSVLQQSVLPHALILVDNGSSDSTLSVLNQWAENKSWVKVISETKPGATAARNAGLKFVKTPYVMFFDSDDVMPPRHIEQISAALKANNYPRIGAFNLQLIDLNGKSHLKAFRSGDPMRQQIFHSILSTQRCVLDANLVRQVGAWNEQLPGWNDWEFGIRLLMAEPKVTYIALSEPVQAYAQPNSITGTSFSAKRGQWEKAICAAESILRNSPYKRLIDYRKAILAGMYRREGFAEYAKGLTRGLRMKLIERYVAAGGRGVDYIARILN